MIELTNGVQISEDRLIQKATASVDSLSSTGKLEVMQYDDKMPVAAVSLTSKAVTWTPPEGAALRVRMGKPDGHGVLNDALGMDADGTVYFAFTRQMTAAHGTGEISVEIGSEGGVKSSAIVQVTVKKNPVQDDKIESGDEYLALDAILEQCQQAAKAVTDNADALQTIRDNAEAIQTTAANIGAIKTAPAAAATVQQYSTQLQTLEENAGVVQQVAQNMNAIQAAPSAANTASEAARTAGTYAEAARQEAANAGAYASAAEQSQQQAAASEAAAAQSAQNTADAAQVLEDNMDAIIAAPSAAQRAAESATAAKLAAQEALGFRTFFSAVRPDENGDFDPSRPMSAPKGSSVTIKSKGDRIQSVQVDGFTTRSGAGDPSLENVREITMGGIRFVELVVSAENVSNWKPNGTSGAYALNAVVAKPTNNASTAKIYCTVLRPQPANYIYAGFATGISVNISGSISVYFTNGLTPEQYIKRYGDFAIWYQPSDESQATGLYIPIKAQGHEYRYQCLPITEALGVGDNVQSNAPSGCDQKVVFNGSQSALSVEDIGSVYRIIYPLEKTVSDTLVEYTDRFPFFLNYTSNTEHFYAQNQKVHFFLDKSKFNGMSSADIQTYLQSHPVILYYRSTAYTPQNDIQVQLEMHQQKLIVIDGTQDLKFSSNYSNLVTLSLPDAKTGQYTSDDLMCDIYPTGTYAEGASQIYVTGSGTTLGIHDSRFTDLETAKTLLSENPATVVYTLATPIVYARDPVTLEAMPYTSYDSDQTIGTYIVSSQDNTTVTVSLKAMQDGGDASKFQGHTWEELISYIDNKFADVASALLN